jgi:hypothetical protein
MINEKSMRAAAKELNDVLGLDPVIDTKAKLAIVTDGVKSALPLIDPKNDEFTDATQAVIDELNGGEEDEPEEEAPKKKGKKPAPVEEEEEDEPEAEEDSLIDQVNAAPLKLSVMTAFVKENAELKPLVKKLATFEKASVLKAAILALLTPDEEEEEEEEEEEVAPVKKGKKPAKDEEEEEEEEAPKKKGTGKGKPASFTSTKESLGTTRMIECAKAMQNIKGSQTIDAIAAVADAKFVKAGGSVNIKQDKNIIKTLLSAAIEWGIVTEKGGKLTNA